MRNGTEIHIKKNLRSCRKQQVRNCQYNANEYDVFKLEKKNSQTRHVHINTDNIMSVSKDGNEKRRRTSNETKTNLHRFNRFLNAFVYAHRCRCRRHRCRPFESNNKKNVARNAANIGNYQHSILHIIVKTSIKYQLPNKSRQNE